MILKYYIEGHDSLGVEPVPYQSRSEVIQSTLDGGGSIDIIPANPDVAFTSSYKGDTDPTIEFDPSSYSRWDKFDALEVGQGMIDEGLASAPRRLESATAVPADAASSSNTVSES